MQPLVDLPQAFRAGRHAGITSVCSAHPLVLRAALRFAAQTGSPALIEATCNQVNHRGGYTGMRPADFAGLVRRLAAREGCPEALVILGGDHLGPNPWREQDPQAAMGQAEAMVAAYVAAGFRKIHLDASMGCRGEPEALDDAATAERAARLAAVAEAAAARAGLPPPVYVIGTEVPPPGGADHVLSAITPTSAAAARRTIEVHRRVFALAGLGQAFGRVIGLVVQPGVEFGNHNVVPYDGAQSGPLTALLGQERQFTYEAHSTDYQGRPALSALVRDGFQILKVGPELTFVLREAFYALDLIASDLVPGYGDRPLFRALEAGMLAEPGHWHRHYSGDEATRRWLRHYSLSDRLRYYWTAPEIVAAVERLEAALGGREVPLPLIWQHLPGAEGFAGKPLDPQEVVIWRVSRCLASYHDATTRAPGGAG